MRNTSILLLLVFICFLVGCEGESEDFSATDDDHAGISLGEMDDPIEDDDTNPPVSDDDLDDDASDDDTDNPFQWPFSAPEEWGPYEVGVTTTYLTDETRFEIWGWMDRVLPVEIWYPTNDTSTPRNRIGDMVGDVPVWGWPILYLLWGDELAPLGRYETNAYRDAQIMDAELPFPVVFFSHGLEAIRFQNFTTCEFLASHGFVVFAMDHYADAIFTNVPGNGIVMINPVGILSSYFDRVVDIRFIYDELTKTNDDPQSPWHGRLDLQSIALTGHSYGGLTTMLSGIHHPFVGPIAPLNPAWVGVFPDDFAKPFFLVLGEDDSVVGVWNEETRRLLEEADSLQKLLANYYRGTHYSCTDACMLLPPDLIPSSITGCGDPNSISTEDANFILNGYITAFFKSTLLGDARYDYYLEENHFPEEIEFLTTWE